MSVVPEVPQRPTGPAHDGRALARCVADPEAFASAWGSRPLLATASELPRSFDDLLDLDGVDELLSRRGLRTPFLRMAKDGVVVDSGRYTRSGGVGAAIGDQVDDTAVTRLFADGTTIVLQALHRLWPPIIEFAGALARELGHPIQVNAYVTPPSSRGFDAHYDIHDVFVLQLAGEKRWIVHEPVHEWPLRSQPWTQRRRQVERAVAETTPTIDTVLRPGDALYLPRGFLHSAEALGDVSAHLTVGIHVVTRQALVEALVAAAEDEAGLRQALPVGLDPTSAEALAEDLEATIDVLTASLRSVDPESVAAWLAASLATATKPSPIAPLEQTAAAVRLTPSTRVHLRPGIQARFEDTGGRAVLRLPGETLEVDADEADAVTALLDGEPWRVDALPGQPESVADLVRRLLVRGVVVPSAF
jgi:hypothetical protein